MNDEYTTGSSLEIQEIKQQLSLTNQKVDQLTNALVELANVLKQQQSANAEIVSRIVQDAMNPVNSKLFQIKTLNSYIARHQSREKNGLIRVVFLVHLVEAWEALHDIYLQMKDNPRFDPIVISISHSHMANGVYAHEDECYTQLVALGIQPIRFNNPNSYTDLEMLKIMDPDIIFRQSPWENSIPPAFHFDELNFAKICYVPYGLLMIPFEDSELGTGSFFYKSCWRMYYNHMSQYEMLAPHFKEDVLRLAGSTKLDLILQKKNELAWPLPIVPNTIRIIWAPHHSVDQEAWMNLHYSTFLYNYQQFLQLARECPEIQIVLKPHPILFSKLVELKLMSQQEVDQFIHNFTSLPNTALILGGDYFPLMWASDLMVTDGISFFSEYMMTEKPIIWTENPKHRKMNEIGELLANTGTYRAQTFDQVVAYIEQLFVDHQDPLLPVRQALKEQLQPNKQGSAQYIVNDIIQGMDHYLDQ